MSLDSWPAQLALMVGVFVGVTLVAAALGAANLGTAMTFGQLAFAATFMYLIVKR